MKIWCAFACAIVFVVISYLFFRPMPAPASAAADVAISPQLPTARQKLAGKLELAARFAARLEDDFSPFPKTVAELPPAPAPAVPAGQQRQQPPNQNFALLAYYTYSEVPPDEKPAETVEAALRDTPVGTPLEEIKRTSDALGIDFGFMKAVARIESDFDPKQRTGSYIGLYQLSNYEFNKYGTGDITNARDNAIAAAYKFLTSAAMFELETHKKPTLADLYLIHQQGTQGAAEHVNHPDWVAWKSMCATDEGMMRGEKWCKRAIWANTLPDVKKIWKSVDNLTSAAFVGMWRDRVEKLYARYAGDSSKTADASITVNASSTADASKAVDASKTAGASKTADASMTTEPETTGAITAQK
jgi:hypothetical protein